MAVYLPKESYAAHVSFGASTRSRVALLALLLLLAALPAFAGPYVLSLATACMIAAVGAIGLNLLTGTTGLVSLGQSGFLAIGAYTNGILIADHHWPVLPALLASGVMAGLVSLLVGVPSLRLKQLYLSITTLAFAFIVEHTIIYAEPVTHGTNGLFLPNVDIAGLSLLKDSNLYWLVLAVGTLLVLGALNLLRTRVGRAWMAIREREIAARVMGIGVARWKLYAFFISSVYVGIAGALLSLQVRFLNVDLFGVLVSIEAIAMIILGGLGSVAGAVLGAVFVTLLPEAIRLAASQLAGQESQLSAYVPHIRGISYGIVIILFLRVAPQGLIGLWRSMRRWLASWPLSS